VIPVPAPGTVAESAGFPSGLDEAGMGRHDDYRDSIMNETIKFRAALLAGLVVLSLAATACNTVEGAGKDTQNLGKDIQSSADKNK